MYLFKTHISLVFLWMQFRVEVACMLLDLFTVASCIIQNTETGSCFQDKIRQQSSLSNVFFRASFTRILVF